MSQVYQTVSVAPKSDLFLRDDIKRILSENPGNPITAAELGRKCGLKRTEGSVAVRKAITELIELEHEPIVALGRGYLIVDTIEALDRYKERLFDRAQGLYRRIQAVQEIKQEMADREEW